VQSGVLSTGICEVLPSLLREVDKNVRLGAARVLSQYAANKGQLKSAVASARHAEASNYSEQATCFIPVDWDWHPPLPQKAGRRAQAWEA
jgi:hypothetical protein